MRVEGVGWRTKEVGLRYKGIGWRRRGRGITHKRMGGPAYVKQMRDDEVKLRAHGRG